MSDFLDIDWGTMERLANSPWQAFVLVVLMLGFHRMMWMVARRPWLTPTFGFQYNSKPHRVICAVVAAVWGSQVIAQFLALESLLSYSGAPEEAAAQYNASAALAKLLFVGALLQIDWAFSRERMRKE